MRRIPLELQTTNSILGDASSHHDHDHEHDHEHEHEHEHEHTTTTTSTTPPLTLVLPNNLLSFIAFAHMQTPLIDHPISTTAASAANAIRLRFSKVSPLKLTVEEGLRMGVVVTLFNSTELVDFLFSRQIASVVKANRTNLSLNDAEWSEITRQCCFKHASDQMKRLLGNGQFTDNIARLEKVLEFTLQETACAGKWASLTTKVVTLLCFQSSSAPNSALNGIFGSIVRSDLRKCDDFHAVQQDNPLDIIIVSALIESVVAAVLL